MAFAMQIALPPALIVPCRYFPAFLLGKGTCRKLMESQMNDGHPKEITDRIAKKSRVSGNDVVGSKPENVDGQRAGLRSPGQEDGDVAFSWRPSGRPRIGDGSVRVQSTLERGLLEQADEFARRHSMSRSQLIARGLERMLSSM